MQPDKKKCPTKQCSAGQVHHDRLDTFTQKLWHLPLTFPRDPFFSRTHPAHAGYLLALAQLRISLCVLLTDPAALLLLSKPDVPPAWPVCAGATRHPGSTTASVLIPHTRERSCHVSTLTALGLQGRLSWMDGCWGMINASG